MNQSSGRRSTGQDCLYKRRGQVTTRLGFALCWRLPAALDYNHFNSPVFPALGPQQTPGCCRPLYDGRPGRPYRRYPRFRAPPVRLLRLPRTACSTQLSLCISADILLRNPLYLLAMARVESMLPHKLLQRVLLLLERSGQPGGGEEIIAGITAPSRTDMLPSPILLASPQPSISNHMLQMYMWRRSSPFTGRFL